MTRMASTIIVNLTRAAALLTLVLVLFATASMAASIDAYKVKIDGARGLAIQLENSLRENESSDSGRRDLVAQVRRDFPASERIDWNGGTVEATNGWLLDKIRSLESETDVKKQLLQTVEIREYLSTIIFTLEELEERAAVDQTKDRDKQKLAEILRREEYQKPQQKQESIFQKWLTEFLQWLESLFPKPNVSPEAFSGLGYLTVVLQVLLYAALLGLLGFLVYKIIPLLFPKLRRNRKPKKKKERVILGEQLSEDATAVDLFAEAERLAREGNLRGAIRKGYIALLCDLSDRKVIGLARNKTNRDYLRDVRSRSELHPRMKTVTDSFERHWYGFQESGDEDWARFRDDYKEAIRSV